jgi:hypothetical protein
MLHGIGQEGSIYASNEKKEYKMRSAQEYELERNVYIEIETI